MIGFVLLFVLGQVLVASIVVAVLQNQLKKELIEAALENLSTNLPQGYAGEVVVVSASSLDQKTKEGIARIVARKCQDASIVLQVDESMKNGLLIRFQDTVLDFGLAKRLRGAFAHREQREGA